MLQTLALTVDQLPLRGGNRFGRSLAPADPLVAAARQDDLAQVAPILPYLLLVLILILRPPARPARHSANDWSDGQHEALPP